MRLRSKWVGWGIAAFVAGCGRSPGTAPANIAPVKSTEDSLSAEVSDLPEPNHFEVRLAWQATERGQRWAITRTFRGETAALAVLEPTVTRFTDATAPAGAALTYVVTTELAADPPLRLSLDVRTPRDVVWEGKRETRGLRGAHRLFLRKDADVRPRSGALVVIVDEILAERGSRVRALPDSSAAPLGLDGKNAPPIWIKAVRASGELEVLAGGEHGGLGLPGAAGAVGRVGASGFDQQTGDAPGDRLRCERKSSDGGPGGIGGIGGRGGSGGRGGDSAPVFVRVESAPNFRALVRNPPGTGGVGGPGAPGGKGGAGGRPGYWREGYPCYDPQPKAGMDGAAGPPGEVGPSGADGTPAPWCLKLGGAVFGSCSPDTPEPEWDGLPAEGPEGLPNLAPSGRTAG